MHDALSQPLTVQAAEGHIPAAPLVTLSQLQHELAFFTPALLVTHGGFDRDVVQEFNGRHPADTAQLAPLAIDLEQPLFAGLGRSRIVSRGKDYTPLVDWDRRLYGIHCSRFQQLRDFICSIQIARPEKLPLQVGYETIPAADLTAAQDAPAGSQLPMFELTVFCIATTQQLVRLAPAVDPPRTRIFPQFLFPPVGERPLIA